MIEITFGNDGDSTTPMPKCFQSHPSVPDITDGRSVGCTFRVFYEGKSTGACARFCENNQLDLQRTRKAPGLRKREFVKFAPIVDFIPKVGQEELIKVVRDEGFPILKKQPDFLEILRFLPESTTEKTLAVTFWAERRDADRYEQDVYPRVADIVRPYLTTPITFKQYKVDTSVW